MRSGFRLTKAAANDIVGIYYEGLKQFGDNQADAYHDGLERVFAFLASYPQAARLRTELGKNLRAYPHKAHVIIYRIEGSEVAILRVRHAREDWITEPPDED